MEKYVIGIGGRINSGKDTIAGMINYMYQVGLANANFKEWSSNKEIYESENNVIHFADKLKRSLSLIYNIPINYFYDRKYKDKMYYCLTLKNFVKVNKANEEKYKVITIKDLKNNNLGDYIKKFNKNEYSDKLDVCIKLRTLLQYFGTNVCRDVLCDNIWVDNCKIDIPNILENKGICIIPDVRDIKESSAVYEFPNSFVLLINKASDEESNKHKSESLNFNYNYVIDNNGSLFSLFYKILLCLKEQIKM